MSSAGTYVALLRGINVGGKNLIGMPDLKAAFEDLGLQSVSTYIQSGNVIFRTGRDQKRLTRMIEEDLADRFSYPARLVLRSAHQMRSIVSRAPPDFGSDPESFRYDVIFLRESLTAAEALKSVRARDGVDQAFAGDGVLYFSRLISRAAQSHLSRIVGLPIYQEMTIRNWNTTTKLSSLMQAAESNAAS
jgi:uncharacterized protein (DUF1697 family)